MKITSIAVEGLFGMFDHRVELSDGSRITIVHGPNGIGKTALLNMTMAACNGKWSVLRGIPFSWFTVAMDDGRALQIERVEPAALPVESSSLKIRLVGSHEAVIDIPGIPSISDLPMLPSMIEDVVPELDRIGPNRWRHRRTGRTLDWPEVFDRYGVNMGLVPPDDHQRAWIRKVQASLNVRLISTDRLWKGRSVASRGRIVRPDAARSSEATVSAYSSDLSDRIRETLALYADKSQQLERTFSSRLLRRMSRTQAPDPHEVIRAINDLEEKRSRVMRAGLLDNEEEFSPLGASRRLNEAVLKILELHAADGQEKLSVFDEVLERVELLTGLVNSKFLVNRLTVSKDGFEVMGGNGRTLPIESLSSGEQHEVVLLYGLLFLTPNDSLVLIDEPELSLDVLWQRAFTTDLMGIANLGGFDVLVATHSPQVVGRHSSRLVELSA